MMIYVAGPLDAPGAKDEGRAFLKEEVHKLLESRGMTTFDAGKPFCAPGKSPEQVHAINNFAVDTADGLFAVIPTGVGTIGTPMEIERAKRAGKPVVCVGAEWSMQLKAMGVPCYTVDRIEDAVDWMVMSMQSDSAHNEEELGLEQDLIDYGLVAPINFVGDEEFRPQRFHPGDAGFDLVCSEDTIVPYQGFADIPSGIRIELPPGMWGLIIGRSSTLRKRHLMVSQSVIDNGWRGPMFAGCWNLGDKAAVVARGERIAQFIPFRLEAADMLPRLVGELRDGDRGEAGFGSTD
jgi:dUTP pyrophosphatase